MVWVNACIILGSVTFERMLCASCGLPMLKRISNSDAKDDTDDCRVCAEEILLRGTAVFAGALVIIPCFEGLAPVESLTGVLGRRE